MTTTTERFDGLQNLEQLKGRTARCVCGTARPSDVKLAFFEYRGEGSRWATEYCGQPTRAKTAQELQKYPTPTSWVCSLSRTAHELVNPHTGRPGITEHAFVERGPREFDDFYCGCRGWD